MSKKFSRTIEDFICGHCGHQNQGNGYTNHCSECLWSKHVDIKPGDRKATCKGLMKPINLLIKNNQYIIEHQCQSCDHTRMQKCNDTDNFDAILKLSQKPPL